MAASTSSSPAPGSMTSSSSILTSAYPMTSSSTSSGLTSGLARKLKKVLEIRTDSPDVVAALSALSSFYDDNSAQARRKLRGTIERRGLALNEEFLQASEAAQKALDVVEAEVQGLAHCCDRISMALQTCAASTGDMVAATERLKAELERTLQRQKLVLSFLHNYQLTAEEVQALRDDELDDRFFTALARVHEIHSNCKVLLRTHHQRAGLELMDVMAVYQDAAYDRLCRWVQSECRNLGDGDNPEISPLLKTAAHSLRERPMLFKYCAEEVANTRHNALFRRFIAALTRGGPGGMPRPIEVHAHDPLRYVGDMLAWLHQALASERELAAALFGSRRSGGAAAGDDISVTSRRFSATDMDRAAANDGPRWLTSAEHGRKASTGDATPTAAAGSAAATAAAAAEEEEEDREVAGVLDRVFEGVCRPFKVRVEQVLVAGQPSVVLAYKLCNLLAFYSHTFSELLGPKAALSTVLAELLHSATRTFHDIIKARGDRLLRFPPTVPDDLSPPPAVAETVAVVVALVDAHNGMMVAAAAEKPDFAPVLSGMLEPLVTMCERAAETYGAKAASAQRRLSGASVAVGSRSSAGAAASAGGGGTTTARVAATGSSGGTVAAGRLSSLGFGDSNPPTSPEAVQIARHIFLTNCLGAVQTALAPHPIAASHVARIGEAVATHVAAMVRMEVTAVLTRCQLSIIVPIMAARVAAAAETPEAAESLPPLASFPETSPTAVSEALRLLFATLARGADSGASVGVFGGVGGGSGGLPEFAAVQLPRLRGEAAAAVAAAVAEAYDVVYRAVVNPRNGYPDPRTMLRHTPEQMRTILGV